jgi:sulfatase maturation enzyme AslB (radical SAM superfamily)
MASPLETPGPAATTVSRLHATLPVFRLDDAGRAILYTPGQAIATAPSLAAEVEKALGPGDVAASPEARRLAELLERRGRAALAGWHALAEKRFEPECLTLYLSNRCNLACSYCYAAPADESRARQRLRMYSGDGSSAEFPILSEAVVCAAARLVAKNCARKAKPLTLVFHGGGEPTLHFSLLVRLREQIDAIARDHGIGVWAYIATHGVLAEDRARFLAAHFSLIGLSCDGPPDVQNKNRPTASGAATAAVVERTARVFAEAGAAFVVRATVTPANVRRQTDIVEYACERLMARSLRFEPAYHGRHTGRDGFRPEHAEEFVEQFLLARERARERGCELDVSGVRQDEIHGPYCNPLREVLQLTPDGVASACFLSTGEDAPEDALMALGRIDPRTGEFEIDQRRAAELRRRAARVPARCESCLNVFHCARDCPDVCVISASPADEQREGFRCRVQKTLGRIRVAQMAAQTWGDAWTTM